MGRERGTLAPPLSPRSALTLPRACAPFFSSPSPPHLQVARDKLVHLGSCIGKLTHSGKFRLTVGSLDLLAQHAKYKVRDEEEGGGEGEWGGPLRLQHMRSFALFSFSFSSPPTPAPVMLFFFCV